MLKLGSWKPVLQFPFLCVWMERVIPWDSHPTAQMYGLETWLWHLACAGQWEAVISGIRVASQVPVRKADSLIGSERRKDKGWQVCVNQ